MSSSNKIQQTTDRIRSIVDERATGDRLPSEAELAALTGVSRVTVREALDRLWHEGRIVRRWGAGTYVADLASTPDQPAFRNIYVSIKGVTSLPAEIIANGHQAALAAFTVERITPPDWVAAELPSDADVWRVTRCLAIDGVPAIVMRDLLPLEFAGQRTNPTELSELTTDLVHFLQEAGVRVVKHESVLDAVTCDEETARLLGLAAGEPILHGRQRAISETGDVVTWSDIFYRTDVMGTVVIRTVND
ncbi:GntR family transcriptional regulator [Saccharopolyspora shandongensis]|uniref:GntR family transcriptional regulator n=1 Tax=Saccharopolyspora shandongensis TaxID=418495 RepID=UPI003424B29E